MVWLFFFTSDHSRASSNWRPLMACIGDFYRKRARLYYIVPPTIARLAGCPVRMGWDVSYPPSKIIILWYHHVPKMSRTLPIPPPQLLSGLPGWLSLHDQHRNPTTPKRCDHRGRALFSFRSTGGLLALVPSCCLSVPCINRGLPRGTRALIWEGHPSTDRCADDLGKYKR